MKDEIKKIWRHCAFTVGLSCRPSGEKIAAIADKLDLKKNVVRVWFCNQGRGDYLINLC
jgi:hypothetical protein